MAENSAGRSEVTFKAWFNPEDNRSSHDQPATGVNHDGGNDDADESKAEVLIGASLGAAAVILAVVTLCVVSFLRRRQPCHRKYAYYVRDNQGNGTTKPPSTHAPACCVRRLVARCRRLLRIASVVDDPKDGEDRDGGCDAADDDDDKFVSSTLQSLLEAKQLFDESLSPRVTTDDEDPEKRRLEQDELLHTREVDETKEESDVVRCPCSYADHEINDSASKTDSEQTGQDAAKELAPDLLTGNEHTFRRGGVARSPYRRSKPKVSFADCHSPSSDLTSGDSTSSQMSSTPRRQVATSDDGVDSVSSSVLRGLSRHSCCVVDLSDSSPTCPSKDETSTTVIESVRRSQSSNAVSATKVPPPPPSLLRTTQERRRQTAAAAGGRYNEVDGSTVSIALPATISGVTEGLFPPAKPERTHQRRAGGECCLRLGPRFSEPLVRRAPRNVPSRTVSHGTEV